MAIVTAFDIAKQHYEAEIEQLTRDLEAARTARDELLIYASNEEARLKADLAEAKAERDKFFDQLSLILNSDSQAVDWEASLETNETPPRPVRVTGK